MIAPWVTIYAQSDSRFNVVMESIEPAGKTTTADLFSAADMLFPIFADPGRPTVQQLALNKSCQVQLQTSYKEQKTLLVHASSTACVQNGCSMYEVNIDFQIV
jgi:hypothetical protein